MAAPPGMSRYQLPSGATFEAPDNLSEEQVSQYALENFPDEFPEFSGQLMDSANPVRPGQEEPGVLGRFATSFGEGLYRSTGSVLPGLGAGFADLIGDEEGFQSNLESIRENSRQAAELNPLPSSFAEVRKKYRENGIGSAALELADLAAQGVGGSLAYVAPSAAVVGASAIGMLSAPAAVLALGGLAGVSTIQFFAEQLERASDEAERKGEKLSSEDVNLAKQLGFAMGQTALDRASLLTTGLFSGLAKNSVVASAANTAAAKTLLNIGQKMGETSAPARAVLSGLSEIVTETGQTAFERAAAGLPVAPEGADPEEYQRALDEYVETWVTSFLVGTGMGGALGHMDAKRAARENEPDQGPTATDAAARLGAMGEDLDDAEFQYQLSPKRGREPSKPKTDEQLAQEEAARRYTEQQDAIIDQIRSVNKTVADTIEQKLGLVSKTARKKSEEFQSGVVGVVNDIRKRARTPFDVMNLMDERQIDFDSTPEADAQFRAYALRTAGIKSLEQATPNQLDRLYKAIEAKPKGDSLAVADVDVAESLLRRLSARVKNTSDDLRNVVFQTTGDVASAPVTPEPTPVAEPAKPKRQRARAVDLAKPAAQEPAAAPAPGVAAEAVASVPVEPQSELTDLDSRTSAILKRLVGSGIVTRTKEEKSGKYSYSLDRKLAKVIKDKDFAAKSDLLLELAYSEHGRVGPQYPRHEEVASIMSKEEFESIKKIHSALKLDMPGAEPISTQDVKPRVEYERSPSPQTRWVVRDETGKVRRVEPSRRRADKFVQGNPDQGLKPPRMERGILVRENTYSGEGAMPRLLKSVPVLFEPDGSTVSVGEERAFTEARRWVVRDKDGTVRHEATSKKKADRFIAENPGMSLKPPRVERVVQGGDLIKSEPVAFESSANPDAEAIVQKFIEEKKLQAMEAEESPDTHFLGTKARGEKGRNGRAARLQRLARSNKPEDIKTAVRMVRDRRNPLAVGRVISSYGFGVEPGSPETMDVGGAEGLTLSHNLLGKVVKKSFPLRVLAGKVMPDGRGFGAAKLALNNGDFTSMTRFPSWRRALDSLVAKMTDEKALSSGEMTIFPDGFGRIVAVWQEPKESFGANEPIEIDERAEIEQIKKDAPKIMSASGDMVIDPEFFPALKKQIAAVKERAAFAKNHPDRVKQALSRKNPPITAVFDMVTNNNGEPAYHLVNMFAGRKDMVVEMFGPDQAKGHPSPYGSKASPRSLALLHDPSHALRFGPTGEPAVEVKYSPIMNAAKGMKYADPGKKPRTLWSYIDEAVGGWLNKPDWAARFRRHFIDQGHKFVLSEGKLTPGPYKEMIADVSTVAAFRLNSNAANLANAALFNGTIRFAKTGVPDKDASTIHGTFLAQDVGLTNESGVVKAWDPELRRVTERKYTANLFQPGQTGGMATVLSHLVKDGQNLVGKLLQYQQALRAWNMIHKHGYDVSRVPRVVQENMREWLTYPTLHPEIAVAHSNLQNINRGPVQLLFDTGVISKEKMDKWLEDSDYTPFYVEGTGDTEGFDRLLGGIMDIDPTVPYKGFFEAKNGELMDPLQALLGNHTRIMAAAINNITRARAIRDQVALGLARPATSKSKGNIVTVRENGEDSRYEIDDLLAFQSIHGELGKDWGQIFRKNKYLKWITTTPSEWLRESVSRSPDFALTNVIRDPMQVLMMNGGGISMLTRVWKRAAKNMARASKGQPDSDSFKFLKENAVITGWGHVGFQGSVRDVAKDLYGEFERMEKGKSKNIFQRAWDLLGRWSAASEAATREIVFEDSYNFHVNELTGNPDYTTDQAIATATAQALHDAREVLNFTRRGDNPFLRALFQMAPFTNAKIQGLDILGRGLFGYAPVGHARLSPEQVRKSLAQRGAIMASASAALALLNYGDDDYEQEDGFTRDMNWLFPIPGTKTHFALPIPFELGTLFKVIPEQITRAVVGTMEGELDRSGRDSARALRHAIVNTLGVSGFLPVASRPLIEGWSNKSIFTDRPIVPFYEEALPTEEQYGTYNTIQARMLSSAGLKYMGMSPRFIDTEIRTVAGGLGVHMWSVMDHVARMVMPGVPTNPAPRLADMVGFKRFVKDEFSSGYEQEIYEFQKELNQSMAMIRKSQGDRKRELKREFRADAQYRPKIKRLTDKLAKIRDRMERVRESDLSPVEKRARLNEIERSKSQVFESYRKLRSRYDDLS